MKELNVAVTGFYGTGSSAVIDLLREYKNITVVPEIGRLYEHMPFYVAGGLFDLYTLLTHGNTPLGSDKTINNFIEAMKRLNDYDYVWFGSYKALFGEKFMNATYKFVNAISSKRHGENSTHILKTRFSLVKAAMQLVAKFVYGRNFGKYGVKYIYDRNDVYFAMPTHDELVKAAQEFTTAYFDLFSRNEKGINVYDHLIWPQQVDSHSECFNDNLKIIILDRDPRDVFLSSKYIWCKPPIGRGIPHFGNDPVAFCDEWRRTVTNNYSNPNALRIHFEDLIYHYEETVKKIEMFLGLKPDEHMTPKARFQPEKSIENTQVFWVNDVWRKDAELIEKELPEYIYHFDKKRVPTQKLMFDSPNS